MSNDRAFVRNAADPRQVKQGKQKENLARRAELDDVRAVLKVPGGRRLLWRLLERCKVLASVWEPSARIHYNAGQQDVGHYILGEVTEADPEAFLEMMRESKERELQENDIEEAKDTPKPEEEEEEEGHE